MRMMMVVMMMMMMWEDYDLGPEPEQFSGDPPRLEQLAGMGFGDRPSNIQVGSKADVFAEVKSDKSETDAIKCPQVVLFFKESNHSINRKILARIGFFDFDTRSWGMRLCRWPTVM